ESGAAKLINAMPPAWAKEFTGSMKHPPLEMKRRKLDELMREHPHHPKLDRNIVETFSARGALRADAIRGPAKLYRIVDPSNEGAGMFWISEEAFKALKNRDEWRSKFAVKPDWNQNGWFVEYEVKAGETLHVWRGPAASQKIDGTSYYLEGGGEQIVFCPASRDKMINALPRVDRKTGAIITNHSGAADRRVEFTDVTGEVAPSKLRAQITDSHIKGPIETGWGTADFSAQEAKRILITVPTT
ncbi:hypothetical protein NX773_18315, partial [Massilia solisilvae]|nr:hypothetical protein [Massilia solisilvae]